MTRTIWLLLAASLASPALGAVGPIVPAPSAGRVGAEPSAGLERASPVIRGEGAAPGIAPGVAPGVRAPGGAGLPRASQAAPAVAPSPATPIIRDPNFVNETRRVEVIDVVPDELYWHTWDGFPYWDYYDAYDTHWYGFASGQEMVWTRYYDGHWWWWDQARGRWLFAYRGNWWWKAPDGALYLYSDGAYTRSG